MPVTLKETSSLLGRIHLFKLLDQNQLLSLAKLVKICEYKEGDYIYQENASADMLYLIYQGEVIVGIETEQQPRNLWILSTDDYFGEDALSEIHIRRTFAKARQNTILIGIPRNDLFYLLEENPALIAAFRLIESSYEKLIHQEPSWIEPEEATRFISRASSAYLIFKSFLPAVWIGLVLFLGIWFYFNTDISVVLLFPLTGVALIFGMAWLIWNIVDWTNDYYLITKRRVVFLEKVLLLYDSRQEAPLSAVLSVTKHTSLMGRILGFSDVVIRTYTGVLAFKHLSSADAVIQLLSEQWERVKRQISSEEREEMEMLLIEKLMPEKTDQTRESQMSDFVGSTVVKSGWIVSTLDSLFGMRQEDESTITYRTHWFILLRKIFFPSLFLIASLILLLSSNLHLPEINANPFFFIPLILILCAFGWWFYEFINWRNDRYLITKDQLVDINRKPLGLEERRSAPIINIQSVEYKRKGFWGILFNFGTVFIRIGDAEFTFDEVHNPSQIQKEIFDRYNALINLEKKNQLDAERKRMASWMEAYHHVILEKQKDA